MPDPSLAAVGMVVRDLERSVQFYSDVIGMTEVRRIDVPAMSLVESIMRFAGAQGARLILMHFSDETDRSYVDTGAKVVFAVDDPAALTEAARAGGFEVAREPRAYPNFGLIAMVKDPDGHTVEAIERIPGSDDAGGR